MGPREQPDLDRDLAQVGQAAAVHPDPLVEGELAADLLVDEVVEALADPRLAACGLEQPLGVPAGPAGTDRGRDALLEGVDPTRQVVAEPDEQVGRRLGVGQRAMRLRELDAEEVRQRRQLVVLEVGVALAREHEGVEVAARLDVGAVAEGGLDEARGRTRPSGRR